LVLEVNSSPGLEGIEKASEIDVADKIIEYLEIQHKVRDKSKPIDI
jgi:ribosomal protein S6--L-glutamate ligase